MQENEHKPPAAARKCLLFFLRGDLAEEVLGDLEEKFEATIKEKSAFRAKVNYWYQVFHYLRPFAMRRRRHSSSSNIDMLKNYFVIGWRNLVKYRIYSSINIGGFALGIAACLLLALFIKGELSYDKHYADGDRIYRVVGHSEWNGQKGAGLHFAHPFGDAIKEAFPEIEVSGYYNDVVNFGAGNSQIRRTDRVDNTHEDGLVFMTQGLIDILELPFIAGNPSKALTEPNSMVITQEKALKYFGEEDPIGKSFIFNNSEKKVYTVTGVIKDFPPYSHLNFSFLMTLEGKVFWEGERMSWCCNNYINYIKLRPGTDVAALEQKLVSAVKPHLVADAEKNNRGADQLKWINSFSFTLQPVDDIYMNQENLHDDLSHGDLRFIWLFGSVAVFILFLACINFINLSTARSANRAKEVGIRKAIGSMRTAIIKQFLTESLLFSFLALLLGVLLTLIIIPLFNSVVGKSLEFPWQNVWLLPSLALGALFIGFVAGIYPAFYLSAFIPSKVLKGGVSVGSRNTTVRSVLVVFQFTISIALIVGTIVIEKQMDYALTKELGFDKDKVMILHGATTLGKQITSLKNELAQLSTVKSATISNYLPVHDGKHDGGPTSIEGTPADQGAGGQQWMVDRDYVKTMGFKIVKGRDFDSKIASDSSAMIINESLMKSLGLTDPIGQRVVNWSGTYTIVGVVEDFHFESLTNPIGPVSMFITKRPADIVSVKLSGSEIQEAVASVEAVWKKFSPHQPMQAEFLDDRYARTYNDMKMFGTIVNTFTTLAIVVACLGLFALSAFMIEQRGKEISIRMVLGASIGNILRLISQNFVALVTISFLIASPLAWYLMNQWLQDYAYKVDITWDIFVVTGLAALAISIATISYQSIKAAVGNPVKNLKSE